MPFLIMFSECCVMFCLYSDSPFVNEPNELKCESVHIQVLGLHLNPHTNLCVRTSNNNNTIYLNKNKQLLCNMNKVATFFFRENPPLPLEFGASLNDRIDKCHLEMKRGADYDSCTGLMQHLYWWLCHLCYFSHNTLIHQMIRNIQTLI